MKKMTLLKIVILSVGVGILTMVILSSCSISKYPNTSTPTKRQIKKAMKYSTWEYNNHRSSSYIYEVSVH
jgi:hypothetical protein